MKSSRMKFKYAIAGLIGVALSACGTTPPSSFYVLTADTERVSTVPVSAGQVRTTIAVGPVNVAGYLDQPRIVQRAGTNQLKMSELNRWGEPLRSNVQRVIIENLSDYLVDSDVFSHSVQVTTALDYRVLMDIARFDVQVDGDVVLVARWRVLDSAQMQIGASQTTTITQTVADAEDEYDAIVNASSVALAELSQALASFIVQARLD